MSDDFIYPNWPAPDSVQAIATTRQGGFSLSPYDDLNLGLHVGDSSETVIKNRNFLAKTVSLPEQPRWLNQVHGTVVCSASDWKNGDEADAIVSHISQQVCTIMTADCLPILLCNQQGDMVAAIHGGWRSLAAGIIEETLQQFECNPKDIIIWLGPAIGPAHFEVGEDVYRAFTQHSKKAHLAFHQTGEHRYLANIYLLARQQLEALGIHSIYGGDFCTVSESSRFFSYRRDGATGRMASLIWLAP